MTDRSDEMPGAGERAESRPLARSGWLSDFEFSGGTLRVRKTGATARLDWTVLWEVAVWVSYYLCLRMRCALRPARGPTIGFVPDMPRPWYLVRSACTWAGIRTTDDPDKADVLMFFEDATWSEPPLGRAGVPTLNFGCTDISKSRVAAVFESVFGYPLALDPETFRGMAVEKSEINSLHDGRFVECPRVPRKGHTYQRWIDTSDDRHLRDLRTPCVGGRPVLVWEKLRRLADPFSIYSLAAIPRAPETMFSPDEIARIEAFCHKIGLDWGGLDILRDRHDGRIYIIDVNKTDVGPIISLTLRQKFASVRLLAAALTTTLDGMSVHASRGAATSGDTPYQSSAVDQIADAVLP